jgi:hypothetical protein
MPFAGGVFHWRLWKTMKTVFRSLARIQPRIANPAIKAQQSANIKD